MSRKILENWRRIPVIVITALDLTPADRKRLNSGVEGILLKNSFDPAHLVQIVRQVVASARRKNQVPEVAELRADHWSAQA